MSTSTGIGYDCHRLVAGRRLVLGGVELEHQLGLEGQSDADVLTHAIIDAMLGACALGDIGQHFPDTDPRYRGADSIELLRATVALLGEAGFAVAHVDATVVIERPKLAPVRDEMRARLAAASSWTSATSVSRPRAARGWGSSGARRVWRRWPSPPCASASGAACAPRGRCAARPPDRATARAPPAARAARRYCAGASDDRLGDPLGDPACHARARDAGASRISAVVRPPGPASAGASGRAGPRR